MIRHSPNPAGTGAIGCSDKRTRRMIALAVAVLATLLATSCSRKSESTLTTEAHGIRCGYRRVQRRKAIRPDRRPVATTSGRAGERRAGNCSSPEHW